jgi:3-oxoacyl-[acyl-carrier protein] reductase
VALVAGSSSGLGRALAEELAAEGASLVLCARTEGTLAEACAAIERQSGAEVVGVAADVSSPGQAELIVREGLNRFGRIDILVTNAGGPPHGVWEDFQSDEAWLEAFNLNFMSTVRMIRAVVPSMRERGGGRILNIQSTSVKAPIPNLILSNTIRPGVAGLAKSLSKELAGDNILVNTVCPGAIYTDRLRSGTLDRARRAGMTEEEAAAERSASIPLKRFGTPEEFANMVVFLASGRATYVTGGTIMVDGGSFSAI